MSQGHSEAQPKNLFFRNPLKSRCFALAQHDIQAIRSIATQFLKGKEQQSPAVIRQALARS
jgi:hypothetical protein